MNYEIVFNWMLQEKRLIFSAKGMEYCKQQWVDTSLDWYITHIDLEMSIYIYSDDENGDVDGGIPFDVSDFIFNQIV